MAIEIATAYVSILPETSKIKGEVSKALGEVGKQSDSAGRSMGSRLASGMGKTLKAGMIGAGAGAAAAFGTALTKGFGRLGAIEQAQAALSGLGHDADSVAAIMSDANEAVTGTAYGLGEAASIAASAVAAGIKPGQDLQRTLKLTGDAAQIAGADLGAMGSIINKVATADMMQMDVANQMMDAGIPILQLVAEEMGVTALEARDLASEGKVSFEIFQSALEEGLGGAALEAGNTVSGSFSNMGAAAGRFGEALLSGPFAAAPGVIGGITDKINTLTNATKAMIDYFSTGVADFGEDGIWAKAFGSKEAAQPYLDFIEDVRLKWDQFVLGFKTGVDGGSLFGSLGSSVRDIAGAFERAWPSILAVGKSLAEAGMGAAVVSLTGAFATLAPLLADVLVPVLESLAEWMGENQELVNGLVLALVGFGTANVAASTLNGVLTPLTKLNKVIPGVRGGVGKLLGNFTALSKTVGVLSRGIGKGLFKALSLATTGVKMLTLAMIANPIGAIVAAVVAATVGLVYFFTQTEKGKEIWQSFMDKLKEIWAWIKDVFSNVWDSVSEKWNTFVDGFISTWESIKTRFGEIWSGISDFFSKAMEVISDVWDKVVEGLKTGFAIISTVVITPFYLAWQGLSWLFQKAWEGIIKPALDAMGRFFQMVWNDWIKPALDNIGKGFVFLYDTFVVPVIDGIKFLLQTFADAVSALWNNYVSPIFTWIGEKFTKLKDTMASIWNAIKSAVFDAFTKAIDALRSLWDSSTGEVSNRWNWLSGSLTRIWNSIKSLVFDAWDKAVNFLKDMWQIAMDFLTNRWDNFKNNMSRIWNWVNDNVFDGINKAIDKLKGWFSTAVDAIGDTWEKLKEKTAAPIRWVIDTVYNNGIRVVWDNVADFVGLDKKLPKVDLAFASGGVLPGYTPGRDPYTFIEPRTGLSIGLSGGEAIMRPEVTRALGTHNVDSLNAAAKSGGVDAVKKHLGQFAGGGVIGSITDLVNRFFPGMSITSTLRPGDPGHHGTGNAVDFSNGTDSTPQMREAAKFFALNYGPGLFELIHSPSPYNIKNGQNVGDGFGLYGAGTMNAHRNHVHIAAPNPLGEPGDPIDPVDSGSGGGGFMNWVRTKVAGVVDKILSPIGNAIPTFGGMVGEYPKAAFNYMKDQFVGAIMPAADAAGYNGPVGAGVEQWRGLVESILEAKGLPISLANSTLRRMNQESGGNPKAINMWDSNAAKGIPSKGLMQVIDPTFQSYKDPGHNDIWDPEANIRASMNYALARYGSLPAAYDRAGGYDSGGWLPPTPGGFSTFFNHTGKPEAVLTAEQWNGFFDMVKRMDHLIPAIDSAVDVVARQNIDTRTVMLELAAVLDGGDFGQMETYRLFGEGARYLFDGAKFIHRFGVGLHDWAKATEEQDRMGTPEEWAQHFGSMAATSAGDGFLSLFGLGGIVGNQFNEPFTNLVNAMADTANMGLADNGVGFRFGHLNRSALVPVDLLDDYGRRKGTKLQANNSQVSTAEPASAGDKKVITLQMNEGDAYSADRVARVVNKFNEQLNEARIDIEMLKDSATAAITSSFPIIP